MPRTPTEAEILEAAQAAALARVWTTTIGEVVSYDHATRTADVRPLIRNAAADEDGELIYEDLPIIAGCKVVFPAGGGTKITWPIDPGDRGALLFTSDDIGGWQASQDGGVANPPLLRRHGIGSALFLPGVTLDAETTEETSIDAIVLSGPTRLGSPHASHKATREDNLVSILDSIKTWAIAHTHIAPIVGETAPPTSAGTYPTTPSDLGSDNVKVD